MENFVQISTDISQDDPHLMLQATVQLRKLLSLENDPPIQQTINSGLVPRLITFLSRNDNPTLQFEALWAITNIASGTSEQTTFVVKQGAVPFIIKLLNSNNHQVVEQAVWALGNIAGDSTRHRDLLFKEGVTQAIIPHLNSKNLAVQRNASWTVSNLCRGKPLPKISDVSPFIPYFSTLVDNPDTEIVTNIMWAVSYISDGNTNQIQMIIDSGVVQKSIKYLGKSNEISTPALRTIGNIVTGDDNQTQFILDMGVLEKLSPLFACQKKAVLKELCWLLSNVTAGTQNQIQQIIDLNIFPHLIEIIKSSPEFEVKTEACWAIANATSGGSEHQLRYLFESGCFQPLFDILNSNHNTTVRVVLEAFENFFKCGESNLGNDGTNFYVKEFKNMGPLHIINQLSNSNNDEIANLANNLLDYLN